MFNVPSVSFGFVSGTMLDFSGILRHDEEHIDLVVAPADLIGPDIAAFNIRKLKELRVRSPDLSVCYLVHLTVTTFEVPIKWCECRVL